MKRLRAILVTACLAWAGGVIVERPAVQAARGVVGGRPLAVQPLARGGSLPEAGGLESRLLADAADGRLDEFSLLEAALIAGGLQDERALERYVALTDRLCEPFPASLAASVSPAERAREVFERMHRELLTGQYQPDCSHLDRTLADGHFNCVTATILYQHLGHRYGLPLTAVAAPGHVFSRLHGQSEPLDIETTCPDWFTLADDPRRRADVLARRWSGADGGQVPPLRELDTVQLIAKVYYNRGVALLEQERFGEALRALQTSVELDGRDTTARDNLLAGLNNWALAECDAGRFERAAQLLASGRGLDADYLPFRDNDLHVHQRWVLALCEQGRYGRALEVLEAGYRRRPEAELFDRGRFAVYRLWVRALQEGGRPEQAQAVLDEARRRHPDCPDLTGPGL